MWIANASHDLNQKLLIDLWHEIMLFSDRNNFSIVCTYKAQNSVMKNIEIMLESFGIHRKIYSLHTSNLHANVFEKYIFRIV